MGAPMKKTALLFSFLLISSAAWAQSAPNMSCQAVLENTKMQRNACEDYTAQVGAQWQASEKSLTDATNKLVSAQATIAAMDREQDEEQDYEPK